jgi:hypothetical protein
MRQFFAGNTYGGIDCNTKVSVRRILRGINWRGVGDFFLCPVCKSLWDEEVESNVSEDSNL